MNSKEHTPTSALHAPSIPPGYKLTEVGVIPEDWEVKPLGHAIVFQRGYDLPHQMRKHGSIPVVSSAGVTDFHDVPMADPPGVVTGRYGTIGELFFISEPFWPLKTTLYIRNFYHNDQKFIYYMLHRFNFQSFSGKSGVPGVNRNDLHLELVSVPTNVNEQRAIAAALSDVDALIAALDRLIAKKRDIKQAAMQQLLTGATRLPGFSGKWEVKRAGDVGQFRGGNGFPIKFQGEPLGTYPFFKVSDMNNTGNETFMLLANNYINESIRKQLGSTVFPAQTIVFAKVGAAVFLERKKILSRPSCIDNNMAGYISDTNRVNVRFIHYVLLNKKLGELVSTTALPSLSGGVLASIEFLLPPLPEQTAIAAVLSDMDAEIAALVQRRNKTKNIKQGMMQELLTGKTRLV